MKILVLIHEFPPVGGGGGRVARDIALGLAERGHEVRVLSAHMDGLPLSEDIGGVKLERIHTRRKAAFRAGLFEMASYDLAAWDAGRRIMRTWQPDVIHAHFAVPAGAAAFALSKLTGIPYALTAHLGDVPGAVPEKTDRWFKWIYPLTPPIWRGAGKIGQQHRKEARRHARDGAPPAPRRAGPTAPPACPLSCGTACCPSRRPLGACPLASAPLASSTAASCGSKTAGGCPAQSWSASS